MRTTLGLVALLAVTACTSAGSKAPRAPERASARRSRVTADGTARLKAAIPELAFEEVM